MASITDLPMPGIATSRNKQTARMPSDNQPKSFDENNQFRFFVTISDLYAADIPPITNAQQLVFKITAGNAFNVIVREPLFYTGGRMYRVFPNNENAVFSGTLTDCSQWIGNVNGNLSASGLPVHPSSGITIEYDVGAGIFTSTGRAPNGTCVLTDTSGSKSTSQYSPNDVKSGVAAAQSFWLVFDHIGANADTKGMFTIVLELP